MGHARALLALEGEQQSDIAGQIIEKGLSVREAEQLIRRVQQPKKPAQKETQKDLEVIAGLEASIQEKLDSPISIKHNASGKGRLVINYRNVDELKKLIKRIK
jgi:ParB family chromosome partitioning protein